MFDFLKKIFGSAQSRILKKYTRYISQINAWEEKLQSLTEEQLKAKTMEFKERLAQGEALDRLLVEAYAVIKNACRRLIGKEVHVSGYDQKWDMVPYDCQLLGAIAMHYGSIAEMQTGEGKTLTAAMPLYLNALTGKPVHLVTVNDYLAKRDCDWIGEIFRYLGLKVAALTNDVSPHARKAVYAADIVYGTASEFGFDYLRDNSMAQSKQEQCQRGHYFAIIDEVDSILIDEARTPLIISGPTSLSWHKYEELKEEVAKLVKLQRDYCNKLASDARKILEQIGLLEEDDKLPKLGKPQEAQKKEALKKLWLVSKGTPQNKTLKRIKENPDLRAELDNLDIYYYAEPNKEERLQLLSDLYMIVDERASEFELTDKGIMLWSQGSKNSHQDFVMMDISEEYNRIDADTHLTSEEKVKKKVEVREEDALRKERAHNLRQLIRAHLLMEKDVDYIIVEDKIVIIDENTGRPQPGRRFSDGLHQAIEAKENVSIQGETQTYATITLQNYFRLYTKLSGMTGTAMTEAQEFKEIYKLEVLAIPTHKRCQRKDFDDEIYMTEREKYNAVLKEVQTVHSDHRPILIGTESVEISEKLSRILKQNKLEHTVLNAKNHAKEAEIIAEAGRPDAITVATNMAGRGTDIKLKENALEMGGLHVIGTTRHQSRRIDRQLRGRSGRQGDAGSSKFFVSFEDSLMRLFTSPRITALLQRFRPPEGEPISAKVLNKSIETAQKRVEQRNYMIRKHTLEYDDVMNKQREEIYRFRNEVLHTENGIQIANEILESLCDEQGHIFFVSRETPGGWNPEGFRKYLMEHFPVTFEKEAFEGDYLTREEIQRSAIEKLKDAFQARLEFQKQHMDEAKVEMPEIFKDIEPEEILQEVVRSILIRSVDKLWQAHLLRIDHLRSEVSLRTIGQKDPLTEFKHEAFKLFDALTLNLKLEIAHAIFKFEIALPKTPKQNPPKGKQPFKTNLSLIPEL